MNEKMYNEKTYASISRRIAQVYFELAKNSF